MFLHDPALHQKWLIAYLSTAPSLPVNFFPLRPYFSQCVSSSLFFCPFLIPISRRTKTFCRNRKLKKRFIAQKITTWIPPITFFYFFKFNLIFIQCLDNLKTQTFQLIPQMCSRLPLKGTWSVVCSFVWLLVKISFGTVAWFGSKANFGKWNWTNVNGSITFGVLIQDGCSC